MPKVCIGPKAYRALEQYAEKRGDGLSVDKIATELLSLEAKELKKHPVLPKARR